MPSPLKERRTGRLGRLLAALRPSRAGPLPVQTGFPTSLADLVVKNHGRLKKPSSSAAAASSRRKERRASPLPSPPPSPSPPPQPSLPPLPPEVAVSPPVQRGPAFAPVGAVRRSTNGGFFGLGLGFLALGGVVSLALLVIWSRKVVAAVTVASFSLFLLDSVRSSALRRRPRAAVPKKLDLAGRGYVSPIREVEPEAEPRMPSFADSARRSEPSFSGSSRRSEPSFSASLRRSDPTFSGSLRRSDPSISASFARRSEASILAIEARCEIGDDSIVAVEERSDVGDGSTNPKAKTKRSWKKLISSKLHKGRKSKEASSSGSFRIEDNAKATDSSDSRHVKSIHQAVDPGARSFDSSTGSRRGIGDGMNVAVVDNIARPIELDAPTDLTEEGDGEGGHRFPFLVVVAVVLVGLVAGTLPAVAFTVLCSAFLSSVQRLPDDGGDRRQGKRRLELAIM